MKIYVSKLKTMTSDIDEAEKSILDAREDKA
jgi:hypothetical protein